jgi:Ca-activated chloride channel family protein
MNFAQPLWLAAGAAACVALLVLHRFADARRRSAMNRFVAPHLAGQLTATVSAARLRLKRACFLLGVFLVFTALARPQWGFHWEETKRTGLDILFAVDTSKSMLAQDVKPDRLARAKLAVTDMVANLEGDRVGLIAFAGSAFLQCPLTLDYDAFYQSLDALDTGIIPRGGTNVSAAIHEAQQALEQDEKREKILILITDGEDLEGAGLDAAKEAAGQGMKIFTVGVGTQGGELIPVPAENGGTEFLKDASGNYVKSKLDASMLQKIAEATGGLYEPLGSRGEGLEAIYSQGLAHLTKHDLASRMRKVYLERFQWPLAAGLVLLLVELMISTRATVRTRRLPTASTKRAGKVVRRAPAATAGLTAALALLLTLALPAAGHASVSQAAKAYAKGDYPAAQSEFEKAAAANPASAELQFNTGASSYKTGTFDKAAESFEKTLQSKDLNLQEQAYYNLGNTLYRIGQKTEKSDKQQTIQQWQQAVQSYEAALQLKPDDADAKYNRDLVKRKLEELQKQQQQEQKDQKQDQQDKKDQDQKDQKDQQNQDQKDSQGQQNQDQKNGNDQKNEDQKDSDGKDNQAKNGQDKKDGKDGKQEQAKNDAKQDQKQNGGGQGKDRKDGQPQEANAGNKGKQDKNQQASAEPRRAPGQMSREEAAQLLDSLKDDAKKFPAAAAARTNEEAASQDPQKDW